MAPGSLTSSLAGGSPSPGRLLKSALRLGPRYRPIFVLPNGRQLAEIGQLAAEGKLKPIIARTYPLAQAA